MSILNQSYDETGRHRPSLNRSQSSPAPPVGATRANEISDPPGFLPLVRIAQDWINPAFWLVRIAQDWNHLAIYD
jgi:hypothetical protein